MASRGVATLYIGNPLENKVSSQLNEQLKSLKLPYFEDNNIIGKINYSSSDIGIIAAIPEEKYWDKTTLQKRWDTDRIRLYTTLIAGNGADGLDSAVEWYNDQLGLAKDFISNSVTLVGTSVETNQVQLDELFNTISKSVNDNPEASIGFGTITQGWILTAMSGINQPNFERVDSLGYVVIVKKDGNTYKTLETYSIQSNKVSFFIGDYKEIVNEKVVAPIISNMPKEANQITGNVIGHKPNENKQDNQKISNIKKEVSFVSFIKNIWGRWF